MQKKRKLEQLPKPIKIKKEKTEDDRTLQLMNFYIDDRLELVKQVFGSLKAKTIMNLAPDFIKVKGLEEMEEMCLSELLCISSKRLKSIITSMQCPSDTESSDDDSDVKREEEHISLEEVSSDSEIESSVSKKGKRKRQPDDANKQILKNKTNQTSTEGDGQISVLELLELQARARAIRSQLAMEPITKIEVDSDEEAVYRRIQIENKTSIDTKEKKQTLNGKTMPLSTGMLTEPIINTETSEKKISTQNRKKIKLKRNYRAPSSQNQNITVINGCKTPTLSKQTELLENQTVKINLDGDIEPNKKPSRSPSPDVIPIIAEPEVLMISDTSDDEKCRSGKVPQILSEKILDKGIIMGIKEIEKERVQRDMYSEPEEGEVIENDLDEKSETIINKVETQISVDNTNVTTSELSSSNITIDDHRIDDIKEINAKINVTTECDANNDDQAITNNKIMVETKITYISNNIDENKSEANEINNSKGEINIIDNNTFGSTVCDNKDNHPQNANCDNNDINIDVDGDENDDIISIEGGDLETEMIEHLNNETNNVSNSFTFAEIQQNTQDNSLLEEVIFLESSGDECSKDTESWHSRYLKSVKVSRVLAVSRLGKRVRDNIRRSKPSSKTVFRPKIMNCEKQKIGIDFISKHEDGSIEQYKELLQLHSHTS